MKNNMDNYELSVTVGSSSTEDDFAKRLADLKSKIVELREVNTGYFNLQKDTKDLAKQFIMDFKDNKVELGKIVSWLGDVLSPDELISIVGDTLNHKDISNLSLKVQNRLSHNYQKPEYFMDDRITNLVNILNVYDNYIESFDSIEVADDLNCLDKNKYLISHDLHNLLLNGFKLKRDRTISKEDNGIYIVVFKKIKIDGKDVLIYKYIKYPYIFYDTLYSYIVRESSSLVITNDKSVGVDYLFVMKYFFNTKEDLISEIYKISDLFKHKSLYSNSRGIYPRNIVDLCKMLLQGCPIFLNDKDISELVKLVSEKKILDAVTKLIELYDFYKNEREGLNMLQDKLRKPNLDNYNFLGRLVFVTEDLDSLINDLKISFDGKVNSGPQKWRGQSDSLSHVIDSIDSDFRKSLNRHNQFHVNVGNIPKNSLIGRSKFSYQNIHLNIGNVRWYSTKNYLKDNSTKKYAKPTIIDYSPIYYEISEYIKNSPINQDTQLKIESALYDHSYISLTNKLSKSNKLVIDYSLINNDLAKLLIGEQDKLLDYINRSRNVWNEKPTKMNEYIQYMLSMILRKLEDEFIISVIYGRLFKIVSRYNFLSNSNKAVDVFVDISNDLIGNYFYRLYIDRKKELKENNYNLSDWKRENAELILEFDVIRGELGGRVITWLKNMDLIWIKLVIKGKEEKENVIVPTERVLTILGENDKIKPLPRRLPMIVKPKNYHRINHNGVSREMLGGYLLNNEKYTDSLIIDKWIFGKSTLIKNDNIIYDLVNNINSVGYKLNKDMFNFITMYGLEYDLIIDPKYQHPLMNKEKLTKVEHIQLTSYYSKLELQENILGVAEVLSNVHEFFIPVRLDFTGRLYCISEYLNYQSSELAKSLIIFSESEKLVKCDKTAIGYMKAYGANCFGNKLDKKSWNDRIKWVDDNLDEIINFKNGNLIRKAEKKLLFIAFCIEYNRWLECFNNDKTYFETSLPIQLDGTCNGYQHLTLLSLDTTLAKELNLTKSTWDDNPGDFYSFTATRLINLYQDKLKDNNLSEEERETCLRLSNLTIARKIVKQAIMTIAFNVSHLKIISYLQKHFIECDPSDNTKEKWFYFEDDLTIKLKDSDFPFLASGLKEVLRDSKFKLSNLLKYLNDAARVCTKLGLPIPWSTPSSGIQVNQSYLATKETRLKVFAYTKQTFVMKVADKSKYNKNKQVRAFMPNLVHSLDADALALLVYYYFTENGSNIKNIYTIHDCFAVTAPNVVNLKNFLKTVYQKIYTEKSYLLKLHKAMIEHIKTHHGDNCIDEDLNISTPNFKGKFPKIDHIVGDYSNTKGWITESSYIIN